jgi:hypothetical protein
MTKLRVAFRNFAKAPKEPSAFSRRFKSDKSPRFPHEAHLHSNNLPVFCVSPPFLATGTAYNNVTNTADTPFPKITSTRGPLQRNVL